MIEEIAKEIVLLLMEEKGMTMREALHTLYTSDTYARLTDTKNQLYTPKYVLCIRVFGK